MDVPLLSTTELAAVIRARVASLPTLFNYTGHPAVVMPRALDREGLPLGIQVVGKRWSESRLLASRV